MKKALSKILNSILAILVYLVFALDRVIMAWTFKELPSFLTWLESDFDYTTYEPLKKSTMRVFTFACLGVFHYFAVWWLIIVFWIAFVVVVGVIGYKDIKKQKV